MGKVASRQSIIGPPGSSGGVSRAFLKDKESTWTHSILQQTYRLMSSTQNICNILTLLLFTVLLPPCSQANIYTVRSLAPTSHDTTPYPRSAFHASHRTPRYWSEYARFGPRYVYEICAHDVEYLLLNPSEASFARSDWLESACGL